MKSTFSRILATLDKPGLTSLLFLNLMGSYCWGADSATSPSIDPLASALPLLQKEYLGAKDLEVKPGDHLNDLIARSGGTITLASAPVAVPIFTASLPGQIIYERLASFTPAKTWDELGGQLQPGGAAASGIVLDLRSNTAPDDYAGAAQALNLFFPADHALAKFRGAASSPSADSGLPGGSMKLPIVVIVNHQTTGAAEVLAVRLQADGALIVGRTTAGRAGIFAEQKLSSGQVLRYLTGTVDVLPWNQPVVPDIALEIHDPSEKAALIMIDHQGILDVIQEDPERHRMSEAALVQGQDPEWDEYLASLKKKPFLLTLPPIHDVALISALDSLRAIQVSQRHPVLPAGPDGPASAASVQ